MSESHTKFSPRTAVAMVVANMVGTGVFTSLGFQLMDIQSGFVILALWVVGGITSVCGAMCYAELGGAFPRSGGEYNFLRELYHPIAGFISGWISVTIGFAAPTALVAMTFGAYLSAVFPSLTPTPLAIGLIVAMTVAHVLNRRTSGGVQFSFTAVKVVLILAFVVAVFVMVDTPSDIRFAPRMDDMPLLVSGSFAVALIYVNYAYIGWNAATYVLDELHEPERVLSPVLISGTVIVMILYALLNAVFMYAAPVEALAGEVEVGAIVARYAFGNVGAMLMSTVLAILLISTVSAMTLAGPRVLQVMGQDEPAFAIFKRTNRDGLPTVAIYFQSALALGFVLTASFEAVLVFTSFTLTLTTVLTILAVFIRRRRNIPTSYRMPLFPLPPLVFLVVMLWTLGYVLIEQPREGLLAIGLVVAGAVAYVIAQRIAPRPE